MFVHYFFQVVLRRGQQPAITNSHYHHSTARKVAIIIFPSLLLFNSMTMRFWMRHVDIAGRSFAVRCVVGTYFYSKSGKMGR